MVVSIEKQKIHEKQCAKRLFLPNKRYSHQKQRRNKVAKSSRISNPSLIYLNALNHALYLSMNQIHNKIPISWHKFKHSDQTVFDSEKNVSSFWQLSVFCFSFILAVYHSCLFCVPAIGCRSNSLFSFPSQWYKAN